MIFWSEMSWLTAIQTHTSRNLEEMITENFI